MMEESCSLGLISIASLPFSALLLRSVKSRYCVIAEVLTILKKSAVLVGPKF